MNLNIFSRNKTSPTLTVNEATLRQIKIDAELSSSVDETEWVDETKWEQCSNPKCPKYITQAYTPDAVVYASKTYCSESCVSPRARLQDYKQKQQGKANREKQASDAIELAKANRITTLRNQIAYCEEHKSALVAAGVDYASHLEQFTTALAAELDPGNTSPNLVIASTQEGQDWKLNRDRG